MYSEHSIIPRIWVLLFDISAFAFFLILFFKDIYSSDDHKLYCRVWWLSVITQSLLMIQYATVDLNKFVNGVFCAIALAVLVLCAALIPASYVNQSKMEAKNILFSVSLPIAIALNIFVIVSLISGKQMDIFSKFLHVFSIYI